MAQLTDLPNELLLMIVDHLSKEMNEYFESHPRFELMPDLQRPWEFSNAQKDMRSFSLSCKTFRPIGQEALFRRIAVTNDNGGSREIPAVAQLIRTLIERPELMNVIKTMDINVHNRGYEIRSEDSSSNATTLEMMRNTSAARSFLRLLRVFLRRDQDQLTLFGKWWETQLRGGSVNAQVGLLLTLTPKLEKLNLYPYYHKPSLFPNGSFLNSPVEELFGSLFTGPPHRLSEIAGFRNLKVVGSTSELTQQLVDLPNLTDFRIRVQSNLRREFSPTGYAPVAHDQVSSAMALEVYRHINKPYIGSPGFLGGLQIKFPRLHSLKFKLLSTHVSYDGYHHIFNPINPRCQLFNSLLEGIPTSIKELFIDTFRLFDIDGHPICLHYWQRISYVADIIFLVNLRTLVVPQNFLFTIDRVGDEIHCCRLPQRLEKIEIILPTVHILKYLEHIVNNNHLYPRLQEICFRVKIWVSESDSEDDPDWCKSGQRTLRIWRSLETLGIRTNFLILADDGEVKTKEAVNPNRLIYFIGVHRSA